MRSKISLLMMSIVLVLLSMVVLPVYAGDATVTDCTHFTGAGTISQAVADANNGGGIISVTCTGTIIFEDALRITADVILNNDSGGEVIFDETGDDNGFFIVDRGASLALNGFTLQNGDGVNGAIRNFGTLTINNNIFMDNSPNSGGAIFNTGTLTINNSAFTGNSGISVGAIYNNSDSTLTINNSTFTDNSATGDENGGGAINNDGTLTLNNSTFTGNFANTDGGAISNGDKGILTISNSTFTDNSANESGGAIFNAPNGTVNISNSTFTDNSSDVGGAIYNYEGGAVSSQDTHYENNTCFGDITDNGGNTATNARGCPSDTPVTDDTGDATISTCDFATLQFAVSVANSGGGTISITCTGTIVFEDALTIRADVILNNDSGGEVIFDEVGDDNRFFFVRGASLTLNGFTLQNGNSTTSGGGAIYNSGVLIINNSTFIDNSAPSAGAIFSSPNSTLTISNSIFTGNSAIRRGGGAISSDGTLTISDSTFTSNSAVRDGGAIFNARTLTITDSTFTDNLADDNGSAIFNDQYGTASSQDTHYENNTCSGDITDNGGNTVTDAPDCPGN